MKIIKEVIKEDDIYFCGPFWIIGDSISNIIRGKFTLDCEKYLCDYNGNLLNDNIRKSQQTHKNAWKSRVERYHINEYNYYPRGRVSIYNGTAWIHLNSICNTPKIIDKIIEEYNLQKLEIEIDLNDLNQGSHYEFILK